MFSFIVDKKGDAMKSIYRRIILKLSGEALAGGKGFGLDAKTVENICKQIQVVHKMDVEIAIVVGGGNFWRGKDSSIDRSTSDYMGMLGTTMNALRLQAGLEELGIETRVQSAIDMYKICESYIRRRAIRHLEKKRIVIFAAGSGNPYFSTDTTAALRAAEIDADVILLGKNGVDGVYDSDPKTNPNAKKYEQLSYIDILNQRLGIMDSTATSLCMDNNIPLVVFGIDNPENLIRVVQGENIGTIIRGTDHVS